MGQYVLGLNPCYRQLGTHDPSAVLFEDNELVFGVEEERFTRDKHAVHTFPERSIRACLEYAGIEFHEVDKIVLSWKPERFRQTITYHFIEAATVPDSIPLKLQRAGWGIKNAVAPWLAATQAIEKRLGEIGTPVPPIETHEHHRCHAASAFYPSPFDQAVILTLDGRGEDDATNVWFGDQGGIERVRRYKYPNSLGYFFGAVTQFLGYYPNNGEGKVMGLAPYGSYNSEIESRLRSVIDTGLDYDFTAITRGNFHYSTQKLEQALGRPRKQGSAEFTQWEKDLAYTAQKLLEETVCEIVEHYCTRFGVHDVALAGGVALNCKMNKRIMELDCVDRTFIQPVSNDAGGAIGAGMLESIPADIPEMSTVYWGPEYGGDRVETELRKNKIDYSKPDGLERYVAERIADGALVGLFDGRLEMGPRALGNRSILADPRTEESLDRVNKFVKHREEWRPFAPSMLEDAIDDYLVNAEPSPYMIKTFDVREDKIEEIPAVIHPADHTTRPQTVREDQNPRYYRIIAEFESLTGVPVVLNTSFNDHGEPIVNRPSEAIKDFFGMGLDTLVINDVLIEKRDAHQRDVAGDLQTQSPPVG